jgi:HAD superfamily hydrolase (TIGR01509 family)
MLGFDCSEELSNDKYEFFEKMLSKGIPPISSSIDFLHHLAQEKHKYEIKLAVASGARKKEILTNLRNLGIESYFDVIISGHDDLNEYEDLDGTNKPKPYIYLKAAKLLCVSPENCMAIEDSYAGLTSAVTAGCITIAIPNEYTQYHDLSSADIKLESFIGLSFKDILNKLSTNSEE